MRGHWIILTGAVAILGLAVASAPVDASTPATATASGEILDPVGGALLSDTMTQAFLDSVGRTAGGIAALPVQTASVQLTDDNVLSLSVGDDGVSQPMLVDVPDEGASPSKKSRKSGKMVILAQYN